MSKQGQRLKVWQDFSQSDRGTQAIPLKLEEWQTVVHREGRPQLSKELKSVVKVEIRASWWIFLGSLKDVNSEILLNNQ